MNDELTRKIVENGSALEKRVGALERKERLSTSGGGGAFLLEGPGIDLVSGSGTVTVGLGGDSILLYHASGAPASEYAVSDAGLTAALAAAVAGDVIQLPPCNIICSSRLGWTLPSGVTLVGYCGAFVNHWAPDTKPSTLIGRLNVSNYAHVQNVAATGIYTVAGNEIIFPTLYIVGGNNAFDDCVFLASSDLCASFMAVTITGSYNTFNNCTFVVKDISSAMPRLADPDAVVIYGYSTLNYFRNCHFDTYYTKALSVHLISLEYDFGETHVIGCSNAQHSDPKIILTDRPTRVYVADFPSYARLGLPLPTDRSAWDVATYATSHASDINAAALLRHNAAPGTAGNFMRDNGVNWVSVALAAYAPFAPTARGDMIAADATPVWSRLALGGMSGSILTRNAADPAWSAFALAGTAGQTYTFPAAGGTVTLGTGAATQIAYWSGTNTVTGNAGLTFVPATGVNLTLGIAVPQLTVGFDGANYFTTQVLSTGNTIIKSCFADSTINVYAEPHSTAVISKAWFQAVSESASYGGAQAFRYCDTVGGAAWTGAKARGSIALPAAVQADDVLSGFNAFGYDGTNWEPVGRVRVMVESIAAGDIEGYIEFTTFDAAGNALRYGYMSQTGLWGFGGGFTTAAKPTARVQIAGTTDVVQLLIYANAAQTANMLEWRSSAGTLWGNITNVGRVSVTPQASGGTAITSTAIATSAVTDPIGFSTTATANNVGLVNNVYGVNSTAITQGAGGASNVVAGRFFAQTAGAAPAWSTIEAVKAIATAYVQTSTITGFSVAYGNAGAAVLGLGLGIDIASVTNSGGGSVTSAIALRIQDQTAGGTNRAIQTGIGLIYFGDYVGINQTPLTTIPLIVRSTAIASTQETIQRWEVSDDATSRLEVINAYATDAVFGARLRGTQASTYTALSFAAQGTTDTGSSPLTQFISRIGASTDVVTRPLYSWLNNATTIMRIDAALFNSFLPELIRYSDAVTNAATILLTLGHNSSGTPAAGFGSRTQYQLETSTTENTNAAALDVVWADATHATRKARSIWYVSDTAEREIWRGEASGTAAMIGFLGAAAIVRPTALTAQLTTITHTAPGTPDYAIQDFVDVSLGVGWAFKDHDEANSVLKVIENLQVRMDELEDKLGHTAGLGLITH